ncbi:MAG: shikimate kinase [Actinomycetota bacterium]
MLWLVGMMGSGKSTVGSRVAERLGLDFVDTDDLVTSVTESTISDLWSARGEETFRRLERQMIASAAAGEPVVVATGGGVVLETENITAMRKSGLVVWLKASPEVLAERIGRDSTRPLLATSDDPVAALRSLLDEREESYIEAAHAVVDTDHRPVPEIVETVLALWNES